MVLFSTILLTLLVLAIIAAVVIALTGAVGIVLFGDVIVFAIIVVALVKLFKKKK